MATYYVSKAEGSDSYDGTSPVYVSGTTGPKLTIGGAEAIGLSAGDIVYVGPGTYYEAVTLTDSGGDGTEIQWRADPDCEYLTGDSPGVVRWTAATSGTEIAGSTPALNFGSTQYVEVYGFLFDGCDSTSLGCAYRASGYDATCRVYDCMSLSLIGFSAVACYRCVGIGKWGFSSCYTESCIAIGHYGFTGWQDGSRNCMSIGGERGYATGDYTIALYNCLAIGASYGFYNTSTDQANDHCHASCCSIGFNSGTRVSCTASAVQVAGLGGTGTVTEDDVVVLPNLDLIKRAWEPGVSIGSLWGLGNDSYLPALDILKRTTSQGTVDIGAYELADYVLSYVAADYETTAPGIKITSEGEVIIQISAEAGTQIVVSLQSKHDSATTKPQATLRGQSISEETKTITAGNDTWEEVTFTAVTPTIDEVLELVLRGREASKIAYFSDIAVV